LGEGFETFSRKHRESLISGVSAGFFFIVAGALFVITPNLFDKIVAFLQDFGLETIPRIGILWPAPAFPMSQSHSVVYLAVERFCFIWGIFEIVLLVLRLVLRSPVDKTTETLSNIVYWFGSGFLVRAFLLETLRLPTILGLTRWFVFWAALIMLLGATLVIRAIVRAAIPLRYTA
jgi:hypothetical protein